MTISIIESFDVTEGTLFTPTQIGTLVIVGAGESAYSSRPIVGITVGGVSCTEVVYTSAEDPKGGVWYIPEALVPAGALEVVVDWNGQTHNAFQGIVYNLASVDQTSPVHSSILTSTNNATGTVSSLDLQFDAIEGGLALVASGVYATPVYFDTSASSAASTITTSVDKNWGVTAFRSVVRSASLTVSGTETIATRYTEIQESFAAVAVFKPAATETIDTDNEVDQFQRTVALNHSLASPLTSVLINGVEHIDVIQNSDAELKYIKRCYDAIGSDVTSVILKNGVDADVTIPSVTVNTTHPYPVPNEAVDSNSMFSGVTVSGSNASFRITSAPTKGTLDLSDPAKYLHDVDASKGGIYTPNAGATGTDSFTFEVHDPDEPVALNRTQSGTVTINIVDGAVVPEPIVELVATIIITGPSELIHKRGTTYTDQGATALDGEGADITSSIITTNNVNDTVVGDYYVYYTVSGVTVRRKVNVVEITENSLRLVNRNRVIGF